MSGKVAPFFRTTTKQVLIHARSVEGSDFYGVSVSGLNQAVVAKAVDLIESYSPVDDEQIPADEEPGVKNDSAILRCKVFCKHEDGKHSYNSAVIWLECCSAYALMKIKDLIESYDPEVSGDLPCP